ncbi:MULTISPECIES: hypothetical protein [unclassified Bradyrhizobium]|uniref:hypothetical protein n=1 Tax=unclassified Bradyrhizobium TaxID=2631580 RepID=UPI001FFA024A|nr:MULTISPECIES: hypothetical protein [unclassified Bradyrhizobium]MCK1348218.1 hypothetical protein [Bradyrhizobium sp. CW11]MCK1705225.1 hypothetical protein [Bradyrhizobium sp. 146]
MAEVPGFAKAFVRRWRIVEMDVWDNDFLHFLEEVHLTFQGKSIARRSGWKSASIKVREFRRARDEGRA